MKNIFKIACNNVYDIDGNLTSSFTSIYVDTYRSEYNSNGEKIEQIYKSFKDYKQARKYIRKEYGI